MRLVTNMRLGNGKFENTEFNSRLQPVQIGLGSSASTQNVLKLDYEYGAAGVNNGNITKQTITVPTGGANAGFTAVQDYTYDELNRLKSAVENVTPAGGTASQTWKQTFTFDRYGNRRFDAANTTTLAPGCAEAVCNPSVDSATNRLVGYTFDASGNTTVDAESRQFTHDAENKQVVVKDQYDNTIGEYTYDGDGKRVKKYVPSTGEVTIFVYDAGGKLIGEYSTEISETPKVSYTTSDHLGSPRIITDENGMIVSRRDFMPFGEEIFSAGRTTALGYTADTIRQKFTGYERDPETDLDFAQARMYANHLGRFTSPDNFVNDTHTGDPRSWNLYIYVRNNPLRLTDPEGKKGEITSRYDKKTGVTTITITASFALYAVAGQNISRKELESYKKNLIDGIKAAFDGKYKDAKTGRSFVIETNISATVFDSKEAATNAGADNLVEFSNDKLDGAWAAVSGDETGSDLVQVVAGRKGSPFESKDRIYQELFGHEFGHLLGLLDSKDKNSLMNVYSFQPRLNSGEDFNKLFGGSPYLDDQGPPIRIGQTYVQQTIIPKSLGFIATSTAPSYEKRYAGISPPRDWISRVKK